MNLNEILKEARWIGKQAKDFANQEALDAYMKAHPGADPRHHKVVQKDNLKQKIEEKKKQMKPTKKLSPDTHREIQQKHDVTTTQISTTHDMASKGKNADEISKKLRLDKNVVDSMISTMKEVDEL